MILSFWFERVSQPNNLYCVWLSKCISDYWLYNSQWQHAQQISWCSLYSDLITIQSVSHQQAKYLSNIIKLLVQIILHNEWYCFISAITLYMLGELLLHSNISVGLNVCSEINSLNINISFQWTLLANTCYNRSGQTCSFYPNHCLKFALVNEVSNYSMLFLNTSYFIPPFQILGSECH